MQWLRSVIHEVHRRSLWQVLGLYLVGSWIAYEVVVALTQGIGLPDWVPGFAVVLFIIGLPVVLATAFVQEGISTRRQATPDLLANLTLEPQAADAPVAAAAAGRAREAPDAGNSGASWLRAALTWRRSLAAGVVAFMLLGIGTAIFLSMRALGIGPAGSLLAAGVVAESDRILIADFDAVGGDSTTARLVTEAFRVDFSRSTLVRPMDQTAVRETLRRMGRTDLPRLDLELAREIALRDGVQVLVTGEVAPAGAGHVLTARLVSAHTGEVLAALRETARREDDLIRAIDRLSRGIRERTGESLRAIRRAEPLDRATTSSLEALRKYTEARRAIGWDGDVQRGTALLEEAVALDSTFAAAHQALITIHSNAFDPVRALEAHARAKRYEDRLDPIDRIRLRAQYHTVRREYGQAVAAYEQMLAMQPSHHAALNNIGIAYGDMYDFERALPYYHRAVAADSTRYLTIANVGETLVKLGRIEEARSAFERSRSLAPQAAWPLVALAVLPSTAGDYDAAEANLRRLLQDPASTSGTLRRAERSLSGLLRTRGRLAEAEEPLASMAQALEGPASAEALVALSRVWTTLVQAGDRDRARRLLADAMPTIQTAVLARPDSTARMLLLAEMCAWVGDVDASRRYLARTGYDGELPPYAPIESFYATAALALAEGNYRLAIQRYRAAADGRGCPRCESVFIARVFDAMGEPDSARIEYENYLRHPSIDRALWDEMRGPAYVRLAELAEQRGDRAEARRYYAEFIRLWERADPTLQPKVREAQRRLTGLATDS
jgi:eukaryotic-like serine/threonine-protein kinase